MMIKKNKEIISYGLIIIVGLFGIYTTLRFKSKIDNKDKLIHKLDIRISNKDILLQNSYNIQLYNWLLGSDSVKNIKLLNFKGEEFLLHELLVNHKFIFYFEPDMCIPCVEKEFLNLEKIDSIYGSDKLIIVGLGFQSKYLFNHPKFKKWEKQIFLAKSKIYSNKSLSHTPTLTLVNSKGNVLAAYHATKNSNKHFELFLEFLNKKLK